MLTFFEENVTISKREYEDLVKRGKILLALEDAGIDNWEGYDYAYDLYEEMNKEDNEKSTCNS